MSEKNHENGQGLKNLLFSQSLIYARICRISVEFQPFAIQFEYCFVFSHCLVVSCLPFDCMRAFRVFHKMADGLECKFASRRHEIYTKKCLKN